MIKYVRQYKKTYENGYVGETEYDVIHETNGKTRWYFYVEDDLPKTVKKFIATADQVIPYHDDLFNEHGVTYWAY
jgi:hypothetical protein